MIIVCFFIFLIVLTVWILLMNYVKKINLSGKVYKNLEPNNIIYYTDSLQKLLIETYLHIDIYDKDGVVAFIYNRFNEPFIHCGIEGVWFKFVATGQIISRNIFTTNIMLFTRAKPLKYIKPKKELPTECQEAIDDIIENKKYPSCLILTVNNFTKNVILHDFTLGQLNSNPQGGSANINLKLIDKLPSSFY